MTAGPSRSGPDQRGGAAALARIVSEAGAPVTVVVLLPLAVAWHATGHAVGPTLGWGLVVALLCGGAPTAFIVAGARRGRWDGHHIRNRDGRLVPLLFGLGCILVCVAVLYFGGAPRELTALLVSMVAVLVVATAITTRWKISLHAAVASGAVATLVAVYGAVLLVAYALVGLVGWARVRLGDHTLAQVLAGAVLGPVAGGAVFLALR